MLAGQDERPSSNRDVLWTAVIVALWLLAGVLTVIVVLTTLFG